MIVFIKYLYIAQTRELLQCGNEGLRYAVAGSARLAIPREIHRQDAIRQVHPSVTHIPTPQDKQSVGLLSRIRAFEVFVKGTLHRVHPAGNFARNRLIERGSLNAGRAAVREVDADRDRRCGRSGCRRGSTAWGCSWRLGGSARWGESGSRPRCLGGRGRWLNGRCGSHARPLRRGRSRRSRP